MSKESWEIGRDVYLYKFNMDNIGGIVMLIFFPVFLILWLIGKNTSEIERNRCSCGTVHYPWDTYCTNCGKHR